MAELKQKPQLPHHRLNARVRELLDADEDSLSRGTRALVYLLKLVRETWRELQEKSCTLRASALAYKTLVGLVPIAAVTLAILSTPSMETKRDQVMETLLDKVLPVDSGATVRADESAAPAAPAAPETAKAADQQTVERRTEIKKTFKEEINKLARKAAAVGATGFVALLIIVLSLMFTVEETFNRIWGVPRGRAMVSRVVSYTAVLFWAPILLATSLSLSTAFTQVESGRLGQLLASMTWMRQVLAFFMPMIISTAALTALYIILPNTRVRFKSALAGALLGALLWELATLGFNLYVKYVVARNPVYGSLGLIPMTFVWLYVTWLVVLFGASVSFTVQNYTDLTRKEERRRRGVRFRVYYAIRTAAAVAARFSRGEPTVVVEELAERLDIPEHAVIESLEAMTAKGLLVPVAGELGTFLPARPIEKITVAQVLEAVTGDTFHLPAAAGDQTHRRLAELLGGADQDLRTRLGTVSLRDLAEDEQASRTHWLEQHGGAPA